MLDQVSHRLCIDATRGLAAYAQQQGWKDSLVRPAETDVMQAVKRHLG